MTASRVINGKKNVMEDTREKLLKIIEELGYVPNYITQSLTLKKTIVIGLVISDITNPFLITIPQESLKSLFIRNIHLEDVDEKITS